MSFNTRLNYDTCTYSTNLKQSVGSGDYQLNTPRNDCRACYTNDPSMRLANVVRSSLGDSTCSDRPLIDVDSELRIMNRRATNCPTGKYMPSDRPFCTLTNVQECVTVRPQEDTRLSNPPCTLRGTGWNRWEWLCKDPQEKALMPFDYNINNRLVVKDNHRPCLPTPLNPLAALPAMNASDAVIAYNPESCMTANTDMPSTTWRKCNTYAQYAKA